MASKPKKSNTQAIDAFAYNYGDTDRQGHTRHYTFLIDLIES